MANANEVSTTIDIYSVRLLASSCCLFIERAEKADCVIDDGNVVDLIADNVSASLADIRAALIYAGLDKRFPKATDSAMHRISVVQ